jgi:hypothetical protein
LEAVDDDDADDDEVKDLTGLPKTSNSVGDRFERRKGDAADMEVARSLRSSCNCLKGDDVDADGDAMTADDVSATRSKICFKVYMMTMVIVMK